ncbi:MAG: J domain-containing protein [Syntrophaceae bacterium]|nr:J domain-containing protein [Syntrophaceae bacterium]
MDPAEVTKQDLFNACESLFGTDIDVSVEFLRYLKPDGVKAAYRKKALETHPDRARVVSIEPGFLEKRFKEINLACQLLLAFLSCPEKYSLDETGVIHKHYKRKQQPARPAAARRKTHSPPKKEPLYRGRMPARKLLFGQFLYYAGHVSFSALIKAVVWQRLQRPSIGAIAASWGWIEGPDILVVLRSRRYGEKFGECALRCGYISKFQLSLLLERQRAIQPQIGKYFVEQGMLTPFQLYKLVEEMKTHNRGFRSY